MPKMQPSIDFKTPTEIREHVKKLAEFRDLINDYELYTNVKDDKFNDGYNFFLRCKGYYQPEELEFIERHYVLPDIFVIHQQYVQHYIDPDLLAIMYHEDTHWYFIEAVRLIYSV